MFFFSNSGVWTADAVIAAIFFSLISIIITVFMMLRQDNRRPVRPTNEAEPTQINNQIGGGLYNPQVQGDIRGGTVSLGPHLESGSFNLNPSPEIKNGGTVVGVPKAHHET